MTCEHWKAWEGNPVIGYCTIRKDVTGVDLACDYMAERPEECVIYLRSDIARLHEANDGWREKVAQVERALADSRTRVAKLSAHWHDVSEENFRALWEEYALCPDEQLDEKAREMFQRYPKAAYMTAIESWRELPDGGIEFTMRRLPSAD